MSRRNPFNNGWLGLLFLLVGVVILNTTMNRGDEERALARQGATTTGSLVAASFQKRICNRVNQDRETCTKAHWDVSYTYEVAGQTYTGKADVALTNDDHERRTAQVLHGLNTGGSTGPAGLDYLPDDPEIRAKRQRFTVTYLPDDPQVHRADLDSPYSGNWVGILVGAVFLLVGGGMFLVSAQGKRLRARLGV